MTRRPIFIIPGYKHKPKNKAYKEIARILKNEGYNPVPVNIPWQKRTISQNTEYFLKRYKKINSRKKYILGFSFGAMIAFIASTKVNVSGLILCSLSPYFKEDLSYLNESWESPIMIKRYEDFSSLECTNLSTMTKAKQISMLYGAKEEKLLIKRARRAYNQITSKNKHLIPVSEAGHDLGNKRYLYAIHQIAKQLN
ncbi:MAG: hypothetical protein M1324_01540 [Patescibacteria group bacterium]|nr:hypothetical protein [Patescibacteria group bacterium]